MLNKKKYNFYPNKKKFHVLKNLKKFINLVDINKTFFIYNGTFYSQRYLFFFFNNYKFDELVITRKFKKTKPYLN